MKKCEKIPVGGGQAGVCVTCCRDNGIVDRRSIMRQW